ncbi:MAG: cysteine desulfurase [Phycisphaerales bacterium]|nr:cysteine desulfurase [Phycisphaerales bacterium]
MIYLDNNATTKPSDAVVQAMERALKEAWANPSSVHRAGQAARREIDLARAQIAQLLGGVSARTITFTSGATESINLAIRGVLVAMPPTKRTIITSPIEHEAIRDLCVALQGELDAFAVKHMPVSREGVVDASALESLIDESTGLVSVQWANNETGAIQPVDEVARICKVRKVLFHSDATQVIGKLLMPSELQCDLLSCSAHKFHGPKGVGVLHVREGLGIRPQVWGVQELGRRGGTENVPGIVGMGAAAREAIAWLADERNREAVATLRDQFERGVLQRVEGSVVIGTGADRLWNTTNIAFPHLEAEALLMLLSESGVAASAGAACSSGSLDPSPVLLAMGVPEPVAHGAVRFSLSRETTAQEIDNAIDIVARCVAKLRS